MDYIDKIIILTDLYVLTVAFNSLKSYSVLFYFTLNVIYIRYCHRL